MLDSFIIERLKKERQNREPGLQPLRIEVPRPEDDPRYQREQKRKQDERRRETPDRGVVIIDFNI